MGEFLNGIGNYFKNLGLSLFGQLKVSVAQFLNSFIQQDLGKMAIDAVQYAATLTDKSGADKQAAAKQKLTDDLKAAGHDVTQFGESILNFLIESAYQAVLAAQQQGILHVSL